MLLSARLPAQLVLLLLGLSMLVLALHHAFAGALYGVLLVYAVTLPLALWRDSPGFGELDVQRNQLDFTVVLLMLATLLVGRALGDLRQALARSAQMQQQLARANLAMEASPLGMTIADARRPICRWSTATPPSAGSPGTAPRRRWGAIVVSCSEMSVPSRRCRRCVMPCVTDAAGMPSATYNSSRHRACASPSTILVPATRR